MSLALALSLSLSLSVFACSVEAIAWLYDRRIPVVLMERQPGPLRVSPNRDSTSPYAIPLRTRIFPLIFDMDLKVTSQDVTEGKKSEHVFP